MNWREGEWTASRYGLNQVAQGGRGAVNCITCAIASYFTILGKSYIFNNIIVRWMLLGKYFEINFVKRRALFKKSVTNLPCFVVIATPAQPLRELSIPNWRLIVHITLGGSCLFFVNDVRNLAIAIVASNYCLDSPVALQDCTNPFKSYLTLTCCLSLRGVRVCCILIPSAGSPASHERKSIKGIFQL